MTSCRGKTQGQFTDFSFNAGAKHEIGKLSLDNPSDAVLRQTIARLRPYYDELGLGAPPATLPALGPGFDEATLDLILEVHPPVVSFHFGIPDAAAITKLKAAGIAILHSATTVAEARALEACGVDAVVAQGWEAGGHRGSHVPADPGEGVGTLALVPQIVDAINLPVIAAGGIADGRGIAAAFALGASGVQIGTGFLSCVEAGTDLATRTPADGAGGRGTQRRQPSAGRWILVARRGRVRGTRARETGTPMSLHHAPGGLD